MWTEKLSVISLIYSTRSQKQKIYKRLKQNKCHSAQLVQYSFKISEVHPERTRKTMEEGLVKEMSFKHRYKLIIGLLIGYLLSSRPVRQQNEHAQYTPE